MRARLIQLLRTYLDFYQKTNLVLDHLRFCTEYQSSSCTSDPINIQVMVKGSSYTAFGGHRVRHSWGGIQIFFVSS